MKIVGIDPGGTTGVFFFNGFVLGSLRETIQEGTLWMGSVTMGKNIVTFADHMDAESAVASELVAIIMGGLDKGSAFASDGGWERWNESGVAGGKGSVQLSRTSNGVEQMSERAPWVRKVKGSGEACNVNRVAMEAFLLRGGPIGTTAASGLSPRGIATAFTALITGSGFARKKLVFTSASEAKSFATDTRLQTMGIGTYRSAKWKCHSQHEKDAARHGVLALAKVLQSQDTGQ